MKIDLSFWIIIEEISLVSEKIIFNVKAELTKWKKLDLKKLQLRNGKNIDLIALAYY